MYTFRVRSSSIRVLSYRSLLDSHWPIAHLGNRIRKNPDEKNWSYVPR